MTSRKLRIPCPGVVGGRSPPTYPIAKTEVSSHGYSVVKPDVKSPAKTLAKTPA